MTSGDSRGNTTPRTRLYWLLVLAVVLLALSGYAGYEIYPRFDLPRSAGIGLFALAAMAGVAAFFSPCSFGLLAVLLARVTGVDEAGARPSAGRAVSYGAALALGAGAFLLLVGAGIALGGGALFSQVTFTSPTGIAIRSAVGVGLILLGLVQLGVLRGSVAFGAVSVSAQPTVKPPSAGTTSIRSQVSRSSASATLSPGSAERVRSWPVWPGRRWRQVGRAQRSSRSSSLRW